MVHNAGWWCTTQVSGAKYSPVPTTYLPQIPPHTHWDWQHCIVHHKKVHNEYAKSSWPPPTRYKATLCTTKELHCAPWYVCLLANIKILYLCTTCVCSLWNFGVGVNERINRSPCAPWCTTQADGAQRRSMVQNVPTVPTRWLLLHHIESHSISITPGHQWPI